MMVMSHQLLVDNAKTGAFVPFISSISTIESQRQARSFIRVSSATLAVGVSSRSQMPFAGKRQRVRFARGRSWRSELEKQKVDAANQTASFSSIANHARGTGLYRDKYLANMGLSLAVWGMGEKVR